MHRSDDYDRIIKAIKVALEPFEWLNGFSVEYEDGRWVADIGVLPPLSLDVAREESRCPLALAGVDARFKHRAMARAY